MQKINYLRNKYSKFVPTPLTVKRRGAYNKLLSDIFDSKIEVEAVSKCLCGSNNLEKVNNIDRFGLPFGTNICKDCGLISLGRRIKDEFLGKYYDEVYWDLVFGEMAEGGSLNTHGYEYGMNVFNFVKENINSLPNEINLLEIGCGTGEKLDVLKKEFEKLGKKVNVFAIDFSTVAVNACKAKGYKTLQGGFEQITNMEVKFNFVILSHLVEHLIDPVRDLKKLKAALFENCLLYIEVPGVKELERSQDYVFDYNLYCVHAHVYNFTLGSLENVVKAAGFDLVKGSEFVRSLFKPVEECDSSYSSNVYEETIESLVKSEMVRSNYLNSFPRNIKRKIKKALMPSIFGQ